MIFRERATLPRRMAVLLAALLALGAAPTRAVAGEGQNPRDAAAPAGRRLGAGATFPVLRAAGVDYLDVKVRSVSARSIVITHRGGMASLRLKDLPPELQQAFGYDPAAAAEAQAARPVPATKPARAATTPAQDRFAAVLRRFGEPPELKEGVDLRPRFNELGLFAKNQGRRPSCAIFAVVSALEYQNAEVRGRPEKLSEEYITWATRKVLGRTNGPAEPNPAGTDGGKPETGDEDTGFSILDVVMALRGYGIPAEERMPDTISLKMAQIAEPDPALIEEARRYLRVAVYPVPGRTRREAAANLIHALNAGIPVVAGMAWPYARSIRTGYIDRQAPMPAGGHAVTFVGYTSASGTLDDVVFIFRNSWGVQWGASGYGLVTCRYLSANLQFAALLEVQGK